MAELSMIAVPLGDPAIRIISRLASEQFGKLEAMNEEFVSRD
ncbi:hypothetical protein [Pseudomonas peradeniyensis]|nr:hypothetical protein [Pseudomonas peradeniyensis]